MSVFEDYQKYGGIVGYTQKLVRNVMDNPVHKYYSSMSRLENGADTDVQLEEVKNALDDKNHPFHMLMVLSLNQLLLSEVAHEAETLSRDQLINKYKDGFLVELGIRLTESNRKKAIDKENGSRGAGKRETEKVRAEAIRLYQNNKNLMELPATTVATKIHRNLIEFMKNEKLNKQDYTSRVIAGWIRAAREAENK